jgi:ADP-ribose pyrophosphatase YjhB (NUDIX family)
MNLRLGAHCAVIDDDGAILLSRRDDLNIWNLPGGRVDAGETLAETAVREVQEETGIIAHIERPVGLYFWAGRGMLNLVYSGMPLGGELRQTSDETRANQYFQPDALPDMLPMIRTMVGDALAERRRELRLLKLSRLQRFGLRVALAWRWLRNWLSRRPEPKFVDFDVAAVALIWDDAHRRVLTVAGEREGCLPRIACDGKAAPWEHLNARMKARLGNLPPFHWVGLWQDIEHKQVELIFAASLTQAQPDDSLTWVTAQNAALIDRDAAYVERVKTTYANDPVWTVESGSVVQAGDTLIVNEEVE